eukprot:s2285_g2.t1
MFAVEKAPSVRQGMWKVTPWKLAAASESSELSPGPYPAVHVSDPDYADFHQGLDAAMALVSNADAAGVGSGSGVQSQCAASDRYSLPQRLRHALLREPTGKDSRHEPAAAVSQQQLHHEPLARQSCRADQCHLHGSLGE